MDLNKRLADLEAEMMYLKVAITEANCKNTEIKSEQAEIKEGDWVALPGCEDNETWIARYGENYEYTCGVEWTRYKDKIGLRKATPEEVKEALIKEAKRRGYKKGINIKPIYGDSRNVVKIINDDLSDYIYIEEEDDLRIRGGVNSSYDYGKSAITVYREGKWATIVEDKLTINGYEVSNYKCYESKSTREFIRTGCKRIHKLFLLGLIRTSRKVGLSEFKKAVADLDEDKLRKLEEML